MNASLRLIELDPTLEMREYEGYMALDMTDQERIQFPDGIECEAGELLHGLICFLKPQHILETGMRFAISTRYMALACAEANSHGHIVTIERDGFCYAGGLAKLRHTGLIRWITAIHGDSLDYVPDRMFDFLWLDSEPEYRYKELIRFWPNIAPGAVICIHDLNDLNCKMFGRMPDVLKERMLRGELRALTFRKGWALSILQKARDDDDQTKDVFA